MFQDPIQQVVDDLAEQLGRSVIIDDASLRPLAVSAQLGRFDASRVDYVLQRRTPDWIVQLLDDLDVHSATGPVHIPADAERETLARVVIPLVVPGRRVGWLWLINDPELSPDQLAHALAAGVEASGLLGERAAAETEALDSGRKQMDDLLDAGADQAGGAAAILREMGLAADVQELAVCAVRAPIPADDIDAASTLSRVASAITRRFGSRTVLTSTAGADGFTLLVGDGRAGYVLQTMRGIDPLVVVGTRRRVPTVDEVPAAAADARFAAEVAACVDGAGGLRDWGELGVYSGLQHAERSAQSLERICPGVTSLWGAADGMYEQTVRQYLAMGGNAQKTAATLHVHRTTLYWRLERVEELVGLDLADGEDRLRLHLALKLRDLMPGAWSPTR